MLPSITNASFIANRDTTVKGQSPFQEEYTHLFSLFHSANAADDDFVTSFKCDHLSDTIRGTRMIDISAEQNKNDYCNINGFSALSIPNLDRNHLNLNKEKF